MSQHDYNIANQTFPNTRTDINNALSALASTSSGTSAPSTTFANQLWYDTANNKLYIRNEDNDANILLCELDQSNDAVEYYKSDSIRTALIEYSDGDDAITIADGGAITTSGNLSIGGSNNELRFYEGSNYVGFESPALTGDQIWILPTGDGSANQTMTTNGSGTLSFGTLAVAGGGTGATSLTANGVLVGNGTSAVTAVDLSTKGKILIGDGSGNPSALAVGSNDQVLTADSSEATGVKWATASTGGGGGFNVESAVNFYGAGGSSVATYSYTGFDSDYDNYWVYIHALSFDADGGHLDFRFLDDGSAVTNAGYRCAGVGHDSNGTARVIDENDTASASLTSLGCNGSDGKPLTGWLYFPLGRGGRWDSDSSDSEGSVAPYMQFHLGYKNTSNYHEVIAGSVHQDNIAGNTCNGFQLIGTSQNLRKVCITIYGIKRS